MIRRVGLKTFLQCRERSLSSDSKAQELSGPCEEKIAGSRRKSEGEAAVKLGLVKKCKPVGCSSFAVVCILENSYVYI